REGRGSPTGRGGQERPEHEKIEVAGVIGEVDALGQVGSAAEPAALHAAKQAHAGGEPVGDHAASSFRANRSVRRTQVTKVPRLIAMRKMNSTTGTRPASFSAKAR